MHPRFLRDLNNKFHGGGSISFIEMISGASDVDEACSQSDLSWFQLHFLFGLGFLLDYRDAQAWKAYTDRMKITSRNVGSYHDAFAKWLEASEFKELQQCRSS